MSQPGKVLALDYGKNTIGLAITDESRQFVFGRGVLSQKKGFKSVISFLQGICVECEIKAIIVGLPLDIEGEDTDQTLVIRKFVEKLKKILPLVEFHFVDESFTTFEARQFLTGIGMKAKEQKENKDELAAILILQKWLEKNE